MKNNQGFLLAELIVALFIFCLLVTIRSGSIIGLLDANRKTQSLKSVMNNLNLALDSMTKEIAVGKDYDCDWEGEPTDCSFTSGGATTMSFISNEDIDGNPETEDRITYRFQVGSEGASGYIERRISTANGGLAIPMTSPEVNITNLSFFVDGTTPFTEGDYFQPRVVIWIDGVTIDRPRDVESSFHVQTSVTQRVPDNIVGDSL